MAKGFRGGFPGGNMNNMMKQVQKLQQQMAEMQEDLKSREIESSSGGGAVKVRVNGEKEVVAIEIDKEVVDPDDVEMLQDLIMVAVNDALKKIEEEASSEMSKLTGGMNIPGL